jgi:hypothetical protein
MKRLLTYLFFWITSIILLMVLGYFLLPSRMSPLPFLPDFYQHNFLLWSWANFDGEHYLRIAQFGYTTISGQSQYAFFPLFPLLIKIIGTVTSNYYLAAHTVVALSLLGFVYYLKKWLDQLSYPALPVLGHALVFPGSIFLLSIYTEPLFLFLTVLSFWLVEQKSYGRAAVVTALATATRVNGIFLALYLLASMLTSSVKLSLKNIVVNVLTSLLGLFGYMTFLYFQTGNPLAFFTAQAGWGKSTLTMPWDTLNRYFTALTFEWQTDLTHLVVLVEVAVTIYLLTLLFIGIRRRILSWPYLIYCLGNLAMPLATGSLGSMPRFGLILFPLFIITTTFSKPTRVILYTVLTITAAIGVVLFTRGYWWA